MAADRKYYTISEVADMIGVSKRTVQSWVSDDDVPHRKFSSRVVRIPAEWVEAQSDEEAAQVSA